MVPVVEDETDDDFFPRSAVLRQSMWKKYKGNRETKQPKERTQRKWRRCNLREGVSGREEQRDFKMSENHCHHQTSALSASDIII